MLLSFVQLDHDKFAKVLERQSYVNLSQFSAIYLLFFLFYLSGNRVRLQYHIQKWRTV